MNNVIEDFIICCKLNNIYKFISRMSLNENNVYTEKGEFNVGCIQDIQG